MVWEDSRLRNGVCVAAVPLTPKKGVFPSRICLIYRAVSLIPGKFWLEQPDCDGQILDAHYPTYRHSYEQLKENEESQCTLDFPLNPKK